MNPRALREFKSVNEAKHTKFMLWINGLDVASADTQSDDYRSDAIAEALFLRAFTSYEMSLEKMFLHYVTGGRSIGGAKANTHLRLKDERDAKILIRAGFKFLSWAKPDSIRETAKNYIENGWPLVDLLSTRAQDLSDCERIRNRIAHNSSEATQQFSIVQRNLLATERLFDLTPGQLLRIRHRRKNELHLAHYLNVMNEMVFALIDPPI